MATDGHANDRARDGKDPTTGDASDQAKAPIDFIREIVEGDRRSGKHGGKVKTRFPPEPNGYLHIGHAKSICINFGIARDYEGKCNLRFDDTNPTKEDIEYVDSIKDAVRWLGFDWEEREFYASDYFEKLYEYALELIRRGKAYVCDLSAEEMNRTRGTLTESGKESPSRNRSIEENLDLFKRMRAGEFPDGSRTLRARIDMASPNLNMRDPALYRIRRAHHHRTGDAWCIYPLYDYTHCLSDAIEGITHSICTLEFENHRPLYDWVLDELATPCHPQQIEFARLNLGFTVMSKRKLLQLVDEGHVAGWDDPRMLTVVGLRRRGYTPESIRAFCDYIGVSKRESWIDMGILEMHIRDDLNRRTPRVMGVLRPLKVVIENYPEGQVEQFEPPYFPDDPPKMGTRQVPFSRELYIEREDFMENPPRQFHRLAPDREVRLRWAYIVRCTGVVKNDRGEVVELRCTYDPDSRTGLPGSQRKVKGTIHWVSAAHAVDATVRLYDRLFTVERPGEGGVDFLTQLNPKSLEVVDNAKLEPSVARAEPGTRYQFERQGYFFVDPIDGKERLVFNRIVTLKDSWAKLVSKGAVG